MTFTYLSRRISDRKPKNRRPKQSKQHNHLLGLSHLDHTSRYCLDPVRLCTHQCLLLYPSIHLHSWKAVQVHPCVILPQPHLSRGEHLKTPTHHHLVPTHAARVLHV